MCRSRQAGSLPARRCGWRDARGNFVARGFWAEKSPIALRVLSRQDMELDEELLATRLRRAWDRRRAIFPGADAFRLAHGEADLLPGYFVDVYGGVAAVQHLAEWTEARREQLARMVVELTGVRAVVARDDGSAREFEHLPRRVDALFGSDFRARYHEGTSRSKWTCWPITRPADTWTRRRTTSAQASWRAEKRWMRSATTAAFPCSWRGRRTR